VAVEIHKEVGAAFRAARVWGPSARFEGQRVGRDHVVADGDVVEILTNA
jgi:ribosome-interacting GTPase 1